MAYRIPLPIFFVLWSILLGAAGPKAEEFNVALQTVADKKIVFATVESVNVVPARVRTGGTIESLTVDEGDRVNAGDVIARVKDPKLGLELRAVDARIESLQSQLKLTETDLQRAVKLRKSGAGSQARLDEAQTNLEVAQRSLVAMKAERSVIAERLEEGAVLAPASGRILRVSITGGSVVLPGETIAVLAEENYILRLYLPERHARFIDVGDVVRVGEPTLEGGELKHGRVRQVYPELAQGRVVADVEVEGLGSYFVGERVPVYVSTGEREVYVVPAKYLFTRYGLQYVKLKDGTEAVIETGGMLDDGVEVLSGIREGDVLVDPLGAGS